MNSSVAAASSVKSKSVITFFTVALPRKET